MTTLHLPDLALVFLIGTDDKCLDDVVRANFADEMIDQKDLELLRSRLKAGQFTVVKSDDLSWRSQALKVAHKYDVDCIALICGDGRSGFKGDDFREVHHVLPLKDFAIERLPLACNRLSESGPFDIVGDVHGCYDELLELLQKLDYKPDADGLYRHEDGRRLVFLGDLVDRGPNTPAVLKLVMSMVNAGLAFCVPGNHDAKLLKCLSGQKVSITHGLAETLDQLAHETLQFKESVAVFIKSLASHLVLDGGRLVVAHAGIKEIYQGRTSGRIKSFCHYGDTNGETDSFGLPVRYNWALDYSGQSTVVYGHTPVQTPAWINNTICVDTGCVFGGALTALRYPQNTVVAVKAHKVYFETPRPFIKTPDWGSQNPRTTIKSGDL